MAGFKRYRKDDPVSYSLGITLTFELLRYKTEYVNKVYVHSAMKEGDTYDKLRAICREAGIPVQQTDKIKLLRDRRIPQISWNIAKRRLSYRAGQSVQCGKHGNHYEKCPWI